jgi:hypothetical protein
MWEVKRWRLTSQGISSRQLREVEGASVERDNAGAPLDRTGQRREHRRLLVKVGQEVLANSESQVVKGPDTDQKGIRAGAA